MENVIPDFLANFMLQSETISLLSDNVNEMKQIPENCETLILNKPIFSQNAENCEKIQKSIKSIAVVGDGDFRLTGDLFILYLKRLLGEEPILECLIMINLEISSEDLQNILQFIKNGLKALKISNVPLEKAHFEALNKVEFNLEFLSLCYFQADEKDAFNSSIQRNFHEKNSFLELHFQNFSTNLKYFELKGSKLTEMTFYSLKSKFSESLQHLILEKVESNEDFIKKIFFNIKDFRLLNTLSLENNCLKNINFSFLEEEIKNNPNQDLSIFPKNLNTFNLSNTELSSKQVKEVIILLKKSDCDLRALHFENCHIHSSDTRSILDLLDKFHKSKTLTIEMTAQALENLESENILDCKTQTNFSNCLQNTLSDQTLFSQLLQNYKELESIKPHQIPPNLCGLKIILANEDCNSYLPIFLKMLLEIKLFQKAKNLEKVDFIKDPKVLLPKNNFQKALEVLAKKSNQDSTIDLRDLQSIGLYKEPVVFRIDPEILKDKELASLSIQNQREKIKEQLAKLGFGCREFIKPDSIVNEFIVLLEDSEYIGWDYRLATFSLTWYDSLNLVVIKFNLSDDWFMERSERKNIYALRNMDFLINAMSEWNIKPLDYIFALEVLKDGETEVEFHHQIMKCGDMNLYKSIIMALDKGFIILKALQKESLFNRDDFSQTTKDAKQIRKIFKAQLKSYSQSEFVANL